jgi:ribosome-binding ATPase YchF (GTP1/OBG family)
VAVPGVTGEGVHEANRSRLPVLYVATSRRGGPGGGQRLLASARVTGERQGGGSARCAKVEAELLEPIPRSGARFSPTWGDAAGLERLIRATYQLLELVSYFTAGPKEVRAWTIRRGTKAPQAAAEIHTDFERGFGRAEVISFADYLACKGEVGAKEKGLMRVEGKEYAVQDGDVMLFRIAT